MRKFKVTIWCKCHDPRAALKAARDMMERDGGLRSYIKDQQDAVLCLIDVDDRPGVAIDSAEIEDVATVGNSEDTGGPHQQEGFQLGHREGLRSCWSASWSAARGGVKR